MNWNENDINDKIIDLTKYGSYQLGYLEAREKALDIIRDRISSLENSSRPEDGLVEWELCVILRTILEEKA